MTLFCCANTMNKRDLTDFASAENLDIKNSKGLGLQLVVNLVEYQLQGRLEIKRGNGTKFIIVF